MTSMCSSRAPLACLVVALCLASPLAAQTAASATPGPIERAVADSAAHPAPSDRLPPASTPIRTLSGFVANHGQWPDEVLFFAREAGIEATLLRDALVLRPQPRDASEPRPEPFVLRLPGQGASALRGDGLLPTKHHFLIGDAAHHRSHVPGYARVVYEGVAPGIDLLVRRESTGFAYDLHVAPGADLADLELALEGATGAHVRTDGVLVLDTASGPVEHRIGAAWEVEPASGARVDVASAFRLLGTSASGTPRLGFEAPARDPQRAFVLDPSVIFSTYIGGSSKDALREIDVGPDGSTYMIVETRTGMPLTPGAPDPVTEITEGWVGKLAPDGSILEWATFLGGNEAEDVFGVHLDDDGTVVAVGRTWSADFPTTPGSLQPESGSPGISDIFVTRLAADGSSLVWSTFYGGPGQDDMETSELLPSGDVVIGGFASASFPPATPGAYDGEWNEEDNYVMRLAGDGSTLVFQTYLRVWLDDIAVDSDSNLYVAGAVLSEWESIGTDGVLQEDPIPGSLVNGVITKLDPAGSEVLWATYLGGSENDALQYITLDAAQAIYVIASATSPDFPLTEDAFDSIPDDDTSFAVVKLLPNATQILWSTLVESPGAAQVMSDLIVDRAGNVIVTGSTNGPDFPTTPDAFEPEFDDPGTSGDATLTKLDAFGESLEYSTYFGGSDQESFVRIGFDATYELRMGMFSHSGDLFVTPDAYDPSYASSGDASVSAWDLDVLPWTVLGSGLKGTTDVPNLAGTGELTPGAPTQLSLRGAEPLALAHFVVGVEAINAPFKGGTFVPAPFRIFNLGTDVTGGLDLSFPWLDVPAGIPLHIQVWMQDPGGVLGWSASNALKLVSQ